MMAREQWCGERRQARRQRQAGRAGSGRTAPRVMGRAQQGSPKHQLDVRTMHTSRHALSLPRGRGGRHAGLGMQEGNRYSSAVLPAQVKPGRGG